WGMESESCIWLSPEDRAKLEGWVAGRNTPQKLVWRARIVLMWAQGAGRVEEGRGGLRLGQSLRFPSPLIKPDGRICRVAQPLLAFAPTDPTVRRYRSGLFRKDPRRADRLAASFTRARFGCKGCQRCVWPFACPVVIPSCRPLFSIASFP